MAGPANSRYIASVRTTAPLVAVLAVTAHLTSGCAPPPRPAEAYDLLITGGMVIDGTGAPRYPADILVHGGRIIRVWRTPPPRMSVRRTIDARGMIVAPGFIDLHAHLEPLLDMPDAESHVRQGVTLAVGGPDGGSPWPIGAWLDSAEALGLGLNLAVQVGHNTVRRAVMGNAQRAPTPEELLRMREMVAQGMREGAFGLSTGLAYTPGAFSETGEVVELARVAAELGGFYTSHIRDEASGLLDAVAETIEIGRQANLPVVITHHKAVGRPRWGASATTLAMVDSARAAGVRIWLDQYPYTATQTGINYLIPAWARASGEAFRELIADSAIRDSIVRGIVHAIRVERGFEDLTFMQFARVSWDTTLQGLRLQDWALRRGLEPTPETGAELIIEATLNGGARVVYHVLHEDDVRRIMRHPLTMIASDGRLNRPGDGHPHPRAYGTFPRVLGRYAREGSVLTLEQAVHKMTGMPAVLLGLSDRGRIQIGMQADITLFDPITVIDRATFEDPHQWPEGIRFVIVNGVVTLDSTGMTGARAGRAVRKFEQ